MKALAEEALNNFNLFLTNLLGKKPYRFSMKTFLAVMDYDKKSISLLLHIFTAIYLFGLYTYDRLSWAYLIIWLLAFPSVLFLIMSSHLYHRAFRNLYFINASSINNRNNLICNLKLTQSKLLKTILFKLLSIGLFLFKLVLLYKSNWYFIIAYVILSYFNFLSVQKILVSLYARSFKYLKNAEENENRERNFLKAKQFVSKQIRRLETPNQLSFYYPQRTAYLFLSAYKNELQVLFYAILYVLLFQLPIDNIYYRFIAVLAMFIGVNTFLVWYSELSRLFAINYFNSIFLWHTSESKMPLIRQCMFPVFSFVGRFNILTTNYLKNEMKKDAEPKGLFYVENKPTTFLDYLNIVIRFPVVYLRELFFNSFRFLQNRLTKNNIITSSGATWKTAIKNRFKKTDFVVIHIDHITENIRWEINQCMEHLIPSRILVLKEVDSEIKGNDILNNKETMFLNSCQHLNYKNNYFGLFILRFKIIRILKNMV